MAALIVRAMAPLVVEDREWDDTAKLAMRLSMYVYPLEPAFLMTMNQSTEAPAWGGGSLVAQKIEKWKEGNIIPLPTCPTPAPCAAGRPATA